MDLKGIYTADANRYSDAEALYLGISRWPLEALKFADQYLRERDVPLLICQGRLNMLDRSPQEEGKNGTNRLTTVAKP